MFSGKDKIPSVVETTKVFLGIQGRGLVMHFSVGLGFWDDILNHF